MDELRKWTQKQCLEGGLRFGDTVVTAQQLREVIRKTQIATRTGVHVQQAAERPARRGTAMEQLRGSRLGGYRYDAQ